MGSEKSPVASGGGERQARPEDSHTCCGCRFPLLIALLQLLLGSSTAIMAFFMATISPSLLARETPHWAGIIVSISVPSFLSLVAILFLSSQHAFPTAWAKHEAMISAHITKTQFYCSTSQYWAGGCGDMLCVVSIVGFVLYCITYLPDERTSMQFIIKLLYFLLCSVGVVISILVIAFQGHHYSLTNGFACKEMGENCVCTLEPEDPIARTFTYAEVSNCSAITSTLMLYYLLQMVLNLAQAIVCMVGAFIMWKHRYQVFFVGLQMGSPTSQHWQKV
ncbi:hypothetical protein SRHO_G00086540 [Serrasalmus rhombeus]